MKTRRTVLLIFMTLACLSGINAQDVIYSQFYANPLYLNPALAGAKLSQRITLDYRNQWPSIKNGYVSYSATWDQSFDKLSGSLGVITNADVGGGGVYNKFSVSGIYSYRLQLTRQITLNAALQAGYMQQKLDWNRLVFGDQIDAFSGKLSPTQERLRPKPSISNVDFSAGLLAGYKEGLYLGVALNHLTNPNISFYEGDVVKLPFRWTVHSGILIDFKNGMDGDGLKNFSVSPNVVYVQQGKFHQLNAGMSASIYPLIAGLWLRHNFGNPDGMIVMLGFQQKGYKIGYSYDYTISKLTNRSGGAHEITMTWIFNKTANVHNFCEMRDPNF